MNGSPPKKKSELNANLILLTSAILFSVISGELFLRFILPSPVKKPLKPAGWAIVPERSWIEYDPDLGWRHKRNITSEFKRNSESIQLKLNSDGLRGEREYAASKPAGIFRVYALGDSFTFGFGVPEGESFPAQMEKMDSALEVLNMGVAGYGVDQIFLALKKWGTRFNPDLVLVTLYPEDFWRATRAFTDAGYGKPYFIKTPDGLELNHHPVPADNIFSGPQFPSQNSGLKNVFEKSYLFRLLQKTWIKILKTFNLSDPDSTPEWRLGSAILETTAAYAKDKNLKLIIALAPPARWISGTTEPLRESFSRFCKRNQIHCLDLTDRFKEASAQGSVDMYYIPEDHHWTKEGNRLAAAFILKEIRQYMEAPE